MADYATKMGLFISHHAPSVAFALLEFLSQLFWHLLCADVCTKERLAKPK